MSGASAAGWEDKGQMPRGVNSLGELDSMLVLMVQPELDVR